MGARLAIVQHGNYAEAANRFAAGGEETFYAQKYSVDFVARLASRVQELSVLHLSSDDPEVVLPSGVRSLGIRLYPPGQKARHGEVTRALAKLKVDHVVLQGPIPRVILWALARRVRLLPLFADSFQAGGLKSKIKFALLARLLRSRSIDWVSNHNLAASLDLARIGVPPEKVVPFDWPALITPAAFPSKTLRASNERKIIYVGQISDDKGVGDVIDAIDLLRKSRLRFSASIIGGHDASWPARVNARGLADRVQFLGRVPHDTILGLMNEHDVVVVPSRHAYPEGLPMTIYEGLCSRSPLVTSDHPMFKLKIRDGENALVFAAGKPAALASCLERLTSDSALYERLSRNADVAAADYFCPLKYDELITRWLSGSRSDRDALGSYSLASGRYGSMGSLLG